VEIIKSQIHTYFVLMAQTIMELGNFRIGKNQIEYPVELW